MTRSDCAGSDDRGQPDPEAWRPRYVHSTHGLGLWSPHAYLHLSFEKVIENLAISLQPLTGEPSTEMGVLVPERLLMNPQRGYCSIVRQIVQPVGNGACYSAVAILAVPHEWVSAEPPARLTPGANLKHRHIEQVPIRFLSLLIHRKLVAQRSA